jgi:hypothetical protein
MSRRLTRSQSQTPENRLIAYQTMFLVGLGLEQELHFMFVDSGHHIYPFCTADLRDPMWQLPPPGEEQNNRYVRLVQKYQQGRPTDFTIEELIQYPGFGYYAEEYLERVNMENSHFQDIYNNLAIWFTFPRFRELLNSPEVKSLEVRCPERNWKFHVMIFEKLNGEKLELVFDRLCNTADR